MSDKKPGPKFSEAAPEAKELLPGVVSVDNPDVAYETDYLHPHENID